MMRRMLRCCAAAALALSTLGPASATAIVPADDAEVIETLPATAGGRSEDRALRRQLAARPDDAALAVQVARRYLEQARAQGDPRLAGLAMAVLRRWNDPAQAPDAVLLMQATLDQYLHDFDASVVKLERLVKRQPRDAQAWLTLATVRRVQGRYADSDAACRGLARLGAALHAGACVAENEGLRGQFDVARAGLQRLLAGPDQAPGTRGWLLTTLAELEDRAGHSDAADRAWRDAIAADADPYSVIGYADHLILNGRSGRAMALLADQPRTDAVLLRLAIAGARSGAAPAQADAREMGERIALANQRPDTRLTHGREQAMFALWVERQPARALELARENVRRQREPLDFVVLAQAARATSDARAQQESDALRAGIGLVDRRAEQPL